MSLTDETARQIAQVPAMPTRPLLICDADEVLLQFAATLETFLAEQGFQVQFESFSLHGNIRHDGTGAVADQATVAALLARFFNERVGDCPPVPGATEALSALAERADIVILTNIPVHLRQIRQAAMERHGMAYPLIANSGLKGPAVHALSAKRAAPVLFIDDLPHNISSVAQEADYVHRIHFIADPRLAPLLGPSEHAHIRIDAWPEAATYIDRHFNAAGY